MDNQTLDLKTFMKSVTEEEADICESDEKQLAAIFSEGWSEETSVRFHRAMLHARRIEPGVTVEGLFELVLRCGCMTVEEILSRATGGCTVSPDIAALAKQRGKKPQKRADRTRRVRGV